MNLNEISITTCVTHHNRPGKLRRALNQIRDTASVQISTRVHENGSTQNVDPELEDMEKEGLIDELICTEENLGIAGSRNLLLDPDEIETEYVLVLDDDMYVGPNWDEAMLSVIDSETNVGVVGAPFMIPRGQDIRDGGQIIQQSSGYPVLDSGRNVLIRQHADYSSIANPDTSYLLVDDVPMGSSLIQTEVLTDVSLASGRTFEDIAFSLDILDAGWKIAMTCETLFYHDKRVTEGSEANRSDWNAKRKGYQEFCEEYGVRFGFKSHLLHQVIFGIPNPLLWNISDIKNSSYFKLISW